MQEMYSMFVSDSAPMIQAIHRCLLRMEREPINKEIVHEAFRYAHSLKSEADYVGDEVSAGRLNELEAVLEDVRQGGRAADKKTIDDMFGLLDEVQETIGRGADLRETGPKGPAAKPASDITLANADVAFTDFERRLLKEAAERGESLYRLVCDIDRGAAMKYARLYLLVSNLEQTVNVVRVEPPLERIRPNEDSCGMMTFYFTAGNDPSTVYGAANIDAVYRSHLSALPLDRYLQKEESTVENGVVPKEMSSVDEASSASLAFPGQAVEDRGSPGTVRLDKPLFDTLLESVYQIQARIQELQRKPADLYGGAEPDGGRDFRGGDSGSASQDADNLTQLSETLRELLNRLRMSSLKDKEESLAGFVRDLSARIGKRILFSTHGFSTEVDRTMVDTLNECVVHLVRNAVDHGIEAPEKRAKAGEAGGVKTDEGSVAVSLFRRKQSVGVQVLDDGSGIEDEEVRRRAAELGYSLGAEEVGASGGPAGERSGLLTLIARPGFSTRREANGNSGRGVGLDLVMRKLKGLPGGDLRLYTKPGEGTVFTVEVPLGRGTVDLLICRRGDVILAIPKQVYLSAATPEPGSIVRDERGLLWYGELEVYTEMGRLSSAVPAGECIMVRVRHMQKEACLYIDEFLFEKNVTEEDFKKFSEGSADLGLGTGFPDAQVRYFNPGIII